MKVMNLVMIVVSILLFSSDYAAAEYIGGVEFQNIMVDNGWCYVQVNEDVQNTCSYFNYRFRFDATTTQGKLMYSSLLMAKALKKNVEFWYTASSAVGTDENSGCTTTTMATAYAVAFR